MAALEHSLFFEGAQCNMCIYSTSLILSLKFFIFLFISTWCGNFQIKVSPNVCKFLNISYVFLRKWYLCVCIHIHLYICVHTYFYTHVNIYINMCILYYLTYTDSLLVWLVRGNVHFSGLIVLFGRAFATLILLACHTIPMEGRVS